MPSSITLGGYEVVQESYLWENRGEIYPSSWWTGVNSVTLKRGREPSEASLLVTKTCLDNINLHGPNNIVISSEIGGATLQGFIPVECEPVGGRTNSDSVFFIKLKDRRVIGELTSWHKKDPSNWHVTVSGGAPNISWATALGSVWTELPTVCRGGSTAMPSLAVTPSSYAENLVLQGDSVWGAVIRCLNACGLGIYYDCDTNTYVTYDPTATQSGLAAAITAAAAQFSWDATLPILSGGICPRDVSLIFPPHDTATTDRLVPYSDRYYIKTLATGVSNTTAGTLKAVTDTSRAIYDFTAGTLSNQTQLDNRVTDFKRTVAGIAKTWNNDWYRVYSGYVGIRPGSEITRVVYELRKRGIRTTIGIGRESWDIDMPFTVNPMEGTPQRLYKYTLSTAWSSGSATASISTPQGTAVAASATVRDPMGVASSLTTGQSGQCFICDGYFVAIGGGGSGAFIENLRLNGNDLQYYKSGAWTTWHTGTTCP